MVVVLLCACGRGDEGGECPALPYFTELPVDETAIASTAVIGGFSPPAHTLPSDHAGIYLNGTGIALRAPGAATLTSIRRTRYLTSTFRAGAEDYVVELAVCSAVRVSFGHLVSLAEPLAALVQPGGCQQYSTANETVQACYTRVNRPVAAGEALGAVGGATAGAFDFGVYDSRHHNRFANPARYGQQMSNALCPWEAFADGPRATLLSRVGRGNERRVGEPACGTMEVDRPGTAEGMWILESEAGRPFAADESPYLTLTRDIVRPAERLFFSVGVPALGAGGYLAPTSHDGVRQRDFAEVTPGGPTTCYDVQPGVFRPAGSPRVSFLLALGTDGRLRVEKREDATACDGAPESWAFSGASLLFVR
jgi:hypothetical protein